MNRPTLIQRRRLHRLSREAAWIVSGQIASIAGTLIGVRVLTRLLSPVEYGSLALGLTLATLLNQVLFGPLAQGLARFFAPALELNELGGYFRAGERIIVRATAGLLIVAVPATAASLWLVGVAAWPIAIAALAYAVLNGYTSIVSVVQNAARQRAVAAVHQGILAWLRFALAAGLILSFRAGATSAISGYALASLLVLASQILMSMRTVSPHVRFRHRSARQLRLRPDSDRYGRAHGPHPSAEPWQSKIWQFSWPMTIFGVFTWLYIASDRWALGLLSGMDAVGRFAVLYQIGYQPIALAANLMMQFLSPILYARAGAGTDAQRNANVSRLSWQLCLVIIAATAAAAALTAAFHAAIFRLFIAPEYASVSHLLPLMVVASGLFAAGQALALDLMSRMKMRTQMMPKICTAALGAGLNFALARSFGAAGVASAAVTFSSVYFAWYALLARRQRA